VPKLRIVHCVTVLSNPILHRIEHWLEPQAVQPLDSAIDETRGCTCGLRIGDCIVIFRVQQHFVQAREHTVRLQQLFSFCFDGLFESRSSG
jgi:hypothetical protein